MNHKKIILKESQICLLKEYMDSSFNWNEFDTILEQQGIIATKKYCIEKLGKPIGEGTSRIVFEIDDHTVLKLSLSKDDVMQNLHECNVFKETRNPLLPKIYAHADDYVWVWSEKVLECTYEDFEKILGIPYNISYDNRDPDENEIVDYSEYESPKDLITQYTDDDGTVNVLDFARFMIWYADYSHEWEDLYDYQEMEIFRTWLKHPWFQNLLELFECQSLDEFFDDNFGIALRNGKPTIVVLDVGWE